MADAAQGMVQSGELRQEQTLTPQQLQSLDILYAPVLELQQKIKKSKYFSNDDDGSILDKYEQETEVLNLTSFEMRLKLKEPVKK